MVVDHTQANEVWERKEFCSSGVARRSSSPSMSIRIAVKMFPVACFFKQNKHDSLLPLLVARVYYNRYFSFIIEGC